MTAGISVDLVVRGAVVVVVEDVVLLVEGEEGEVEGGVVPCPLP